MEVLLRHAGHYEAKDADLPELWDTLCGSISDVHEHYGQSAQLRE
jgi:hypothetical protein